MEVKSAKTEDLQYVASVAEFVFRQYAGGLHRWKLCDSESIWKIHFGARAGVLGVDLNGRRCCVKLFYDERRQVKLRNSIGFSKAKRAFKKGLELEERGVACPEMVGYAVGNNRLAVLVTELMDDAVQADLWIADHGSGNVLAEQLGSFLRKMHDAGVEHIDLSLRNMLIQPTDDSFDFFLLDYEDTRFGSRVTEKKRIENLHHMNERALTLVPLRYRLRFLRAYLGVEDIREWVGQLNRMIACYPSKYTKGLSR